MTPFLVRLRPNVPYLVVLGVAIVLVAVGVAQGGLLGLAITVGAGVLTILLGAPVVVSTVFRVPVIAVTSDGVRLPLMGVRLSSSEISSIRTADEKLFVIVVDPQAVIAQARPWLRAEARANLARHGTPIVVSGRSLDRPLTEIAGRLSVR
jgi:hypothetical protein